MTKSRFPDSLVLIFAMIVVAQIATLVLPAGEYERDGRAVLPGTYERIEVEAEVGWRAHPVGQAAWILPAAVLAVPRGMTEGADIIFFVFLVGGAIGIDAPNRRHRRAARDGHRPAGVAGPCCLVGRHDDRVRGRIVHHRHGRGVHALHPDPGHHVPGPAHGRGGRGWGSCTSAPPSATAAPR